MCTNKPVFTLCSCTGRKPRPGESWCPVCGVTLRAGELESHLTHELDKLARLPQTRPLAQRTPTPTTANPTSTTPTPTTSVVATVSSPLSPHLPIHARARDPGWDVSTVHPHFFPFYNYIRSMISLSPSLFLIYAIEKHEKGKSVRGVIV